MKFRCFYKAPSGTAYACWLIPYDLFWSLGKAGLNVGIVYGTEQHGKKIAAFKIAIQRGKE